jgi:hypothetical protein
MKERIGDGSAQRPLRLRLPAGDDGEAVAVGVDDAEQYQKAAAIDPAVSAMPLAQNHRGRGRRTVSAWARLARNGDRVMRDDATHCPTG